MNLIMNSIFPFSESWSWSTFILYIAIAIITANLCKKGAKLRAYNEKNNKESLNYEIYYIAAFAILVLLATLRTENVGSDTRIYVNYFKEASYYKEVYGDHKIMEQGFLFYNLFIRNFTSNYTVYFLITYSFIAWAYICYIKNHFDEKSEYIFLQIFIFYYTSNMSGVRSAIGVAFLLFSYVKLSKGKNIQAILLTLLATSFHYTSIINFYMICMVVLFKNNRLLKRRWIWVTGIVATMFISYIGVYQIKAIFEGTKYEFYSSVNVDELSIFGSLFFMIFIALCILNYRRIFYKSKENEKLKTSFIISMALAALYPIIYITGAYRIPNYYIFPRLVVWSEINNSIINRLGKERKDKTLIRVALQIIAIMYLLFKFTRSALDGFFMYEFIF